MTKTKTSILAMIIAIATIGLLTSTISFSNSADAQKETIPEWIQNVALFWGQGDISESEFVNALEFLGDEGILKLPTAESAEAQEISASIGELEQRLEQIEATQITPTEPTSIAPTPEIEPEDTRYPTTFAICPSDKVRHFDKVLYRFQPHFDYYENWAVLECDSGDSIRDIDIGVMILEEKHNEINQQINIKERLMTQLKADNCAVHEFGDVKDQLTLREEDIQITSVDYAVICANQPGTSETSVPTTFK
jgi:hypothetical protein